MDTPDSNRRRRGDDSVDAPAATPAVKIPDGDMTPAAEAAILELVAEIDRLKEEIAATRKRIVFLEYLADEDPLTPVANRRVFICGLTRVAALVRRHSTPSSVLYFDIDGMKTINDRFGHAAGDKVLVANVRASDLVGRLGGDEFGIILAHTDDAAAKGKAAVLAKGIAELGIEADGRKVPVSATFGISAITGVEDAEAALAAADKAMYEHK